MSLKCCNKVCQIIETVDLCDTRDKTHKALVIGRCRNPQCGALRAQLIYYDVQSGRFVRQNIKSRDVKKTIDHYKRYPYEMTVPTELKSGSRQNQLWIYGITRQIRVGKDQFLEHWACNFNNEKKLVERRKI